MLCFVIKANLQYFKNLMIVVSLMFKKMFYMYCIFFTDGLCGTVPQTLIDDEADILQSWHNLSVDISGMVKVTKNAYRLYLKSRPAPSSESIKRMKSLDLESVEVHPIFNGNYNDKFS